jgi:hypothetical protein
VCEVIILKGRNHKQGKVCTPGEIALEDRVPDVPAPYRQALACTFFQIASTNHGPFSIAFEYSPTRFYLIIYFGESEQPAKGGENP